MYLLLHSHCQFLIFADVLQTIDSNHSPLPTYAIATPQALRCFDLVTSFLTRYTEERLKSGDIADLQDECFRKILDGFPSWYWITRPQMANIFVSTCLAKSPDSRQPKKREPFVDGRRHARGGHIRHTTHNLAGCPRSSDFRGPLGELSPKLSFERKYFAIATGHSSGSVTVKVTTKAGITSPTTPRTNDGEAPKRFIPLSWMGTRNLRVDE